MPQCRVCHTELNESNAYKSDLTARNYVCKNDKRRRTDSSAPSVAPAEPSAPSAAESTSSVSDSAPQTLRTVSAADTLNLTPEEVDEIRLLRRTGLWRRLLKEGTVAAHLNDPVPDPTTAPEDDEDDE